MTYPGQFGSHFDDAKREKLARRLFDERSIRDEFFPNGMFGESAWDALLLLFSHDQSSTLTASDIATRLDKSTSVTSRWLKFLEEVGLVESRVDRLDPRRTIVEMTVEGRTAISAYLATIGEGVADAGRF